MKNRFCLSVILALVAFHVYSQDSRINLSIKSLVSDVSNTDKWSISDKYRLGWQISAGYTSSFSKNVDYSLGAELSFWQVGFEEWATWPSMLSATAYESFQFTEVMIPFNLSFNLKDTKFFVTTGVAPTFVLSALHSYNYFEPQVDQPWRSVKLEGEEYAAFNIAVKMGVGVKFFGTKKVSWVLSPEIQTNLFRDSPKSFIWFTTEKIRRWNLGVSLGIQYKLKVKKKFRTLG